MPGGPSSCLIPSAGARTTLVHSPRWGHSLVWDGKYDEYGCSSVDVTGAAMPMQKNETVDMPRSEALASGQTTLGELGTTMHDFRNRLIWGDNKLVMASLLNDFRGKIDLIDIDPPFDVPK